MDDFTIDTPSEELSGTDTGMGMGDTGISQPDPGQISEDYLKQVVDSAKAMTMPGSELDINREAAGYANLIQKEYYDYQGIDQHLRDLYAQRQAGLAPLEKSYAETVQGMSKIPAPKMDENVPTPEYFQQLHTTAGKFASILGLMVAMSPLLVRRNANAALTMFGASIQGYMQGKQTLADEAMKEYQINLEATTRKNDHILQQYKLTMDKYGANLEALRVAMQQKALEFKDPITHGEAQKMAVDKNIEHLYNRMDLLYKMGQDVKFKGMEMGIRMQELGLRTQDIKDRQAEREQNRLDKIEEQKRKREEDVTKEQKGIEEKRKRMSTIKSLQEAMLDPYGKIKPRSKAAYHELQDEYFALQKSVGEGGPKSTEKKLPTENDKNVVRQWKKANHTREQIDAAIKSKGLNPEDFRDVNP